MTKVISFQETICEPETVDLGARPHGGLDATAIALTFLWRYTD